MPDCEAGIGEVILSPGAEGLIHGVCIQPFQIWPDDRGYFFEVMRAGQGLAATFPLATSQMSAAFSYPGTIKAFHYHLHQTDLWVLAHGMFQAALVDMRPESRT